MKIVDIYENFLTEKILDVQQDVDIIYDKFFRKNIEKLNNPERDPKLIKEAVRALSRERHVEPGVVSNLLKTPELDEAQEHNPVKFIINSGVGNMYRINRNPAELHFSVNDAVLRLLKQYEYSIDTLSRLIKDNFDMFLSEMTEGKMKGSIHHELAHWYDDTMHNYHLANTVKNNPSATNKPEWNTSHIEIEGQIHTLLQFKKMYGDELWDSMTFDELLTKVPALSFVERDLDTEHKEVWKRRIKSRMARENLLGKNMR